MTTATATYTNRPMQLVTPLGPDALRLTAFTGQEGISQLFHFQLDLLARNSQRVAFDKLLGQPVTVRLAPGRSPPRSFHGIVSRISQGVSDDDYISYRMDLVPRLWLLTNQAQCRIFQHLSVPEILKKVLVGFDVESQIQGTFHPREFCVQYRETDFNFISRLMEEEGIYYFFKHGERDHTLVLANTPPSHPAIAEPSRLTFVGTEVGPAGENFVYSWEKVQELRPGKYTLFDHHFELPHKHLEADQAILPVVQAGTQNHPFKIGVNEPLEIYDYPGEYAHRFDGVNCGGGDQSADLQKVFEDSKRTAEIRMQQEAVSGLAIFGSSDCSRLAAGHKFTLNRHVNADGCYVLTRVSHFARNSSYRSGGEEFS